MPRDTQVPDDDRSTERWERPELFDIEREEPVLARAVDRSVPIGRRAAPDPSGPAGRAPSAPAGSAAPSRGPMAPAAQPAVPAAATRPVPAAGPSPAGAGARGGAPPEEPMPDRPPELPAFPMVRRGYDPGEVDAYLVRSEQAVARAVARADAAERQLAEAMGQLATARANLREVREGERAGPPASIQALGDRVARILGEAWEAAEELRRQAAGEADRARAAADEISRNAEAEARRRAAAVVAEADEHRRRVVQELAARRSEHEAEVARLDTQRAAALAELERIHALLQRALAPAVGDGPQGEAVPPPPGPAGRPAEARPSPGPPAAPGRAAAPGPRATGPA